MGARWLEQEVCSPGPVAVLCWLLLQSQVCVEAGERGLELVPRPLRSPMPCQLPATAASLFCRAVLGAAAWLRDCMGYDA